MPAGLDGRALVAGGEVAEIRAGAEVREPERAGEREDRARVLRELEGWGYLGE